MCTIMQCSTRPKCERTAPIAYKACDSGLLNDTADEVSSRGGLKFRSSKHGKPRVTFREIPAKNVYCISFRNCRICRLHSHSLNGYIMDLFFILRTQT